MRKLLQIWPGMRSNGLITVMGVTSATLILSMLVSMPKYFLWNASASVPIGLYFSRPKAVVHVGDLAVTELPTRVRNLADQRGYLPLGVLLIKPVSAQSGAQVCRYGFKIRVNGQVTVVAKSTDRMHRLMPIWTGCRHLPSDEVFLMNPAVSDSFDGRYFGPTKLELVRGRALPLFTFGTSILHRR